MYDRSEDRPGPPAYSASDWLDLHGLTEGQCRVLLARAAKSSSASSHVERCGLSGDEAWQLAADAMTARFPCAASLIERVCRGATRVFQTDAHRRSRPHTFPAGPGRLPIVHLSYDGTVVDLLTVAHEFGHSVQSAATGGGFVPPVVREICAFVAELALLARLRATQPELYLHTLRAWQSGNRIYLHREGKALARELGDPQSAYRYGWNYPIARILASACAERLSGDRLWSLFENRVSLPGLVRFFECGSGHGSCNAACLAAMQPNLEPLTTGA